jgi:hypothetical protein
MTQTGFVPACAQSPHQRVKTEPGDGLAVIVKVMMSPSTRQALVQTTPPG